ncbi:ATP-binding protein [Paenibacillus sp. GCM10027626]|uniref:sensor histidine kinase n=1 Tax=Paenibacillus sp. GCM10027626 TaxID=3273411 RepID=UPI0036292576
MLFVWIALWLAAALLLISDRKNPSIRWLSLLTLCGGMGALASVIEGWIIMLEGTESITADQERLLRIVQRCCSWMSYYGLPYSFLNFAFSYHGELLARRGARAFPYLTALPVLAMLFLPISEEGPVHYDILVWWALPYTLAGTILLLLRKRGSTPMQRRSNFIVIAAVLPAVLIATTMNHVMPLFGLFGLWRYNVWPITFAFIIFVIALFNYGFLGVRLFIERQRMDYSLRAITSGTAMLNHAIKNDIGKIKLFSDKIEQEAVGEHGSELKQDVQVISEAARRIEAMIRSVHDRTQELPLQRAPVRLAELVRAQVALFERSTAGDVRIIAAYDEQSEALIDEVQTAEAIRNVLHNAWEAMTAAMKHKETSVVVKSGKRGSYVEIKDNGAGIEKRHLRKVTEPFFTTKSGKEMNFGLGLAYCYQLMRRQGGELRIQSEPGQGTTVTFYFPAVKAKGRI